MTALLQSLQYSSDKTLSTAFEVSVMKCTVIYLLTYTMSVSEHNTFSAQSNVTKGVKVKISLSDKFLRERYMLSSFLI